MVSLTLPNGTIVLNDSAFTLPEARRVEHDYYSLIDSSVGSSMDDIDRHFNTMIGLVGSGDDDAQLDAINNTRFLFANLLGRQYSARSLALCCLVDSVNGVPWIDYSEEGLEQLSKLLSELGLTDKELIKQWGAVKKNSGLN